MAEAERSTCRSGAVRRPADQVAIAEHHIYDIWANSRRVSLTAAAADLVITIVGLLRERRPVG
jgi:hypothetical protein